MWKFLLEKGRAGHQPRAWCNASGFAPGSERGLPTHSGGIHGRAIHNLDGDTTRILDPYFTFGQITQWDYKVLCGTIDGQITQWDYKVLCRTIEGIATRRSTNILKDGYGGGRKGAISLLNKLRKQPTRIRTQAHGGLQHSSLPFSSQSREEGVACSKGIERHEMHQGFARRPLRWHG